MGVKPLMTERGRREIPKNFPRCITWLAPVAIRLGQSEVNAPDHAQPPSEKWNDVECSSCKATFAIAPNRIYGSRITEAECRKAFEAMLADDHAHKREHPNGYKIPDWGV